MAREYAVPRAVAPHFPEAPRVYHLCEDANVIGAVFFLMERRRGIILRDESSAGCSNRPPSRISEAFIDCQARLHAIDIQATGLIRWESPRGSSSDRYADGPTVGIEPRPKNCPQMDRVIQWLIERLPNSTEATLVHNDYKLDNIMLSEA